MTSILGCLLLFFCFLTFEALLPILTCHQSKRLKTGATVSARTRQVQVAAEDCHWWDAVPYLKKGKKSLFELCPLIGRQWKEKGRMGLPKGKTLKSSFSRASAQWVVPGNEKLYLPADSFGMLEDASVHKLDKRNKIVVAFVDRT